MNYYRIATNICLFLGAICLYIDGKEQYATNFFVLAVLWIGFELLSRKDK